MSTTEMLIQTRGLNTHYGASHILRGIDFGVARGETIGLMGRNGMGKSTLLKSIMGLVKPSGGSVHIKGEDKTGAATYDVARLGIAYVPEGRGIFGNLSVKENLIMSARAGVRGQRDWTYERVLETFPRLAERLNHGGQQLSGGEQQMLTIGRTLMGNPKLLMVDEPTEGLSPIMVKEVRDVLRKISASGISILLVEHNLKVAMSVATRVYLMGKAHLGFTGTVEELAANPEAKAKYLEV